MIDIKELLFDAGGRITISVKPGISYIDLYDDSYAISCKEPIEFNVYNDDFIKLVITATGLVTVQLYCDRCLEEVKHDFNIDYRQEVRFESEGVLNQSDLQMVEYINDSILDTDKLITNELIVKWPTKILCKQDCKGICIKCGANLNIRECGCDRTTADPRMAVIQDIFKQSKEV